jgi:hypothetical protein
MTALPPEVRGRELEAAHIIEVRASQEAELGQEIDHGPSRDLVSKAESIERNERLLIAPFEDEPDARNPVGLFAVDQMADHVSRCEGVRPLARVEPGVAETVEKLSDGPRSSFQDFQGSRKIEAHFHQCAGLALSSG